MKIHNVTRDTTIADRAEKADTFVARGKGLMFSRPLPDGGGLVIEPCNSIHMFFMRFPLDVIFTDTEGRVVFMYKGIKPWRMGRIVHGARRAIELPEGTIERSGTQAGDVVRID